MIYLTYCECTNIEVQMVSHDLARFPIGCDKCQEPYKGYIRAKSKEIEKWKLTLRINGNIQYTKKI